MFDKFQSVLTHFETAEVHIINNNERTQINLFEFEDSPKIRFNGFESTINFGSHLKSNIDKLKRNINEYVSREENSTNCLLEINEMRFEVKSFRKFNFPLEVHDELLNRLKYRVNFEFNKEDVPKLKFKILQFFAVQLRLLDQLIDLIEFFYKKIKKHFIQPGISKSTTEQKKSIVNNQLELFSESEFKTTLTWSRDKTEFLELIVALYELDCFKSTLNHTIPKYKFIEFMTWMFNVEINQPHRLLNASKNRKVHESAIFSDLKQAYINFTAKN